MPILPIKSDCFNTIAGVLDAITILQSFRIYPSVNDDIERVEMINAVNARRRSQLIIQRDQLNSEPNLYYEDINIFNGLPVSDQFEVQINYLANIRGVQDIAAISNDERKCKEINTISFLVQCMLQDREHPSDQFQGGFSMNKGKFIISKLRQYPALKELASNLLSSKTSVESAWRQNKSVAHIQFAYTILPNELKALKKTASETLRTFLGYSYYVQELLMGIQSPYSLTAMIKAEEMWLIPLEFAFLAKGMRVEIPPYHPDIKNILKGYKYK